VKNAHFSKGEKRTTRSTVDFKNNNNNGEQVIQHGEEEEGRGDDRGGCGGYGEIEAWADQDMDGIGVALQGYFCIACASEIEYDRSVDLFESE